MNFNQLSAKQLENANHIKFAFMEHWKAQGVTASPILIAGALGLAYEETGLELKPETSYRNTPAKRIRQIFAGVVTGLSDAQIDQLKTNDVNFFSFVYAHVNGNRPGTNDGYIYRGGGFNQLTGINAYLMCELPKGINSTAEEFAAGFARFQWKELRRGQQSGKFRLWMGCNSTTQFLYPSQGAYAIWAANTGWGVRPEHYSTGRYPICELATKEFHAHYSEI